MKNMNLSKRMEAVVSMVSPQSFTVADIGCDHAYVSIALIERNLAKHVIAMDVRKGPLEIAAGNVKRADMEDFIELRLGDGLEKLSPGEADTIIIAGMGGLLVKSILEKGFHKLAYEQKSPTLILQPQSDLREVRIFLYSHAYHIVRETMLIEDGKYYTVLHAEPGEEKVKYSEAEWVYGAWNLENRDDILYQYLQKEKLTLEKIMQNIGCPTPLDETADAGAWQEAINQLPEKTQKRCRELLSEWKRNAEAINRYRRI